MKNWTTKEIQYLKKNALLAETNVVLNAEELAKKLGRSPKSIDAKIYKLRRDNQFPQTDFSKSFDPKGRKFTDSEDKRIISMYKKGESYEDIGNSLDRSRQSIAGRITRLKKIGKLKQTAVQKNWTQNEVDILLSNIQFDENGYCCNHTELGRLCNRTYEQVAGKINRLRRDRTISTSPKTGTTSINAKKSMNRFNDARFAAYPRKEEPIMNVTPVITGTTLEREKSVDIQSKQVTVILTSIIIDGKRTDQYFLPNGQLIAVKKEPTSSANEVSR
ncbi:helix-turn-helix domain containing protein [Enterococcus songbeiensis]